MIITYVAYAGAVLANWRPWANNFEAPLSRKPPKHASVSYCPHDHIQLYLKRTYKELGYTTKVKLVMLLAMLALFC